MKEYEQFLKKFLDEGKYNSSNNRVMKYDYDKKNGERNIIKKLEELGLIDNVTFMGMFSVGFDITYNGLHYFDEQDELQYISPHKPVSLREYDVFISHANKDKMEYVEQLYDSLKKLGINIFYDQDTIQWGEKWKQKIIEGTHKSEFAIIVISKNYFGREWTERELNEFLSQENNSGEKLILPIIHGISHEELAEHYHELCEIQTISSEKYSTEEIALLFAKTYIKRLKDIL